MSTYHLWKCDDGTFDICDADGVAYQNMPERVARVFVLHADMLNCLIACLACIEKHVPKTEFAPREWAHEVIAKAEGEFEMG